MGPIEQRDPIEEGHLTRIPDVYSLLLLLLYRNLDRFAVWAPSLPVLPIPAERTFPRLSGFALIRLVPLPLAAEAPDLARVVIHEDGLLYWSSVTWYEGCRFRGWWCWGRESCLQLVLDQLVEVGVLDAVASGDQVLLDDEILLHDLIQSVLRIPTQFVEGILELHFSSEAIDFPNDAWVSHIRYRLIDEELLWSPASELPPLRFSHGGVERGLSTNVDGDGVSGVAAPCSSSDIRIVGVILNVPGEDRAGFVVPFAVFGVRDVDGVEVSTFKLIVNEAWRWSVGIFHDAFVINAASRVFLDWKRADSQLQSEWPAGVVVIDWGIVGN